MKLKKITAGLLAFAVACSGIVITSGEAKAAAPNEIKWVETEVSDIDDIGFETVPEGEAGYVFAGWYDGSGDDAIALTNDTSELNDTVYTKWIPASWLTVKAQNKAGTSTTTASTDMRVAFAIDSLDYKEVGFTIQLNNDTSIELENTSTKLVYSSMEAGQNTYQPSDLFGNGAKYLAVWRIKNINKDNYSKIIYVRPYIKTADGTKVEGMPKYVHVEDGYKKLVNIPVSIKAVAGIAAGVASISFDNAKLTYEGYEAGRIFNSEMDAAASGNSVKFVGNVSDINNNVANADDIYVNLRFSVKDNVEMNALHSKLEFNVSGSDFCDKDEQSQEVTFTDVRY